ncbi:MAG: PorP/SprF family type IX secretion system membrane protein [Bacteroidota bacterium]|nr:PorP/SprF family type IX secretion system membrane protein [Bacteroidota bacterium]
MSWNLRYFVLLWIGTVMLGNTNAQQMPLYSQYMMNGFVFNPAIAGADGFTTINLSARDHWVGLDNSPKTFVLSAQTRLYKTNFNFKPGNKPSKRSGRVGVGACVYNDRNGAINRTGGQISYAYHISMQKTQLSMGLSVSTFQVKIDQSQLQFFNQEPLLNSDFSSKVLVPDISVGGYLLSSNAFLGLSADNLFQSRIKLGSEGYDYRMYRHYFLMGGKRFQEDQPFSYEPSFLLKATEKGAAQADLQLRGYYMHDYYIGLSYRTGTAVGILLGAKWRRAYFGYAFDYTLSGLQKSTLGSQEINITLKLGDNARRYRWMIRY